MPGRPDDDDILAELRDIQRRLRNLETAPQAPNSSQRGGSFKLIPEDGTPELLSFGTYEDGGGVPQYGVAMRDKDDAIVIATREDKEGLLMPFESTQWMVPTPQSITSATMVSVAECEILLPALPNIYFTAALVVPVGTVAQIDVFNLNTGVVGTNQPTINGLTGTYYEAQVPQLAIIVKQASFVKSFCEQAVQAEIAVVSAPIVSKEATKPKLSVQVADDGEFNFD